MKKVSLYTPENQPKGNVPKGYERVSVIVDDRSGDVFFQILNDDDTVYLCDADGDEVRLLDWTLTTVLADIPTDEEGRISNPFFELIEPYAPINSTAEILKTLQAVHDAVALEVFDVHAKQVGGAKALSDLQGSDSGVVFGEIDDGITPNGDPTTLGNVDDEPLAYVGAAGYNTVIHRGVSRNDLLRWMRKAMS